MISCQLHDYIEIACLYHYRVRLTLQDGSRLSGRAVDTGIGENKAEFLKVETDAGVVAINQNDLRLMQALDDNPHFSRVEFE
jgi:Rho-binding antiterminator